MRLLLLFLTFLFTLHGASDNDYSIIIKGAFKETLFDITQDHDNQISAVGYSQHFSTKTSQSRSFDNAFDYLASHAEDHGEQLRVLRLDSEGDTTLDRSMALSRFNRAVSLIKTPSNGYLIGGYTLEGELLLLSLTSQGSTNFIVEFGTANFDRMHRLIALRDGGVLAVGSSMTSRTFHDPRHKQGLGLDDIFLVRFSKTGQKLWSKKYGTPHDDRGIDAVEAHDGSIIVIATQAVGKYQTLSLMRITENGDKIWLNHYGQKNFLNAYDLIALRDNNFLASLSYQDKRGEEQIRLLKFDLQQNTLAEHNVTTDYSSALFSIKERSNGKLIATGYSTDHQRANTDALAISFDAQLHPIWKQHYDRGNHDLFHAVTVLSDGSFAAAGETVSAGNEHSDMWIVKLNTDGSIASKSHNAKALYDTLHTTFSDEINNNQVSLTEDLKLTLQHPDLLFNVNIYELTEDQKSFLSTFSQKLLDTLHSHKSEIIALRINGHTSSEWKGADFTQRYLKNVKLSTQRAYSMLTYIFTLESTAPYRQWLSKIITNDGYAFSKTIMRPLEDKVASRRSEFQVILQ